MNGRLLNTCFLVFLVAGAIPPVGAEDTGGARVSVEVQEIEQEIQKRIADVNERVAQATQRIPEMQKRVQERVAQASERAMQVHQEALERSKQVLERQRERLAQMKKQLQKRKSDILAFNEWENDFRGEIVEEKSEFEFPASEIGKLSVETQFASILVRAEDVDTIRISAVRQAGAPSQEEAQEELVTIELTVEKREGVLSVKNRMEGSSENVRRTEIVVVLPPNAETSITNEFGPMAIKGLAADLEIEAQFAPTTIEDTKGELDIRNEHSALTVRRHEGGGKVKSSFSTVHLDDITITDDVHIQSDFSPIILTLAEKTEAEIRANAGKFGVIHSELPGADPQTGNQLKATLGDGGPRIELVTDFGDIHIEGENINVSDWSMISKPLVTVPDMPSMPPMNMDVSVVPKVPRIPETPDIPDVSRIIDDAFTAAFGERRVEEAYREEWTIPIENPANLRMLDIHHDHGNIIVVGTESGPYDIQAVKRVYSDSEERAREVADQYTIEAEYRRATATLKIESVRPRNTPKGIDGAAIDYFVRVPKDISLNVDADHGDFEARSIRGDVDVHHDHGHVTLRDVRGGVYSEVDHGNLAINALVSDNLEIEHDHGNVEVDDCSGPIECTIDHGDVILDDISGPLKLNYKHGNVRVVTDDDLQGEWEIEGRHGDCYLVLSSDAQASLSLETKHGEIKSTWPIEIQKERHYQTATVDRNGGGTSLGITVRGGDIRID